MSDYPVLDRLKTLNERVPDPPPLPSAAEVDQVEALLGRKFPPSYRHYLLTCSNMAVGAYELCWIYQDGSRLDLVKVAHDAWAYFGLPEHLLPFLADEDSYTCFDTAAPGPEYPVVRWSGQPGAVETTWPDFPSWVEQSWLPTAAPAGRPSSAAPEKIQRSHHEPEAHPE